MPFKSSGLNGGLKCTLTPGAGKENISSAEKARGQRGCHAEIKEITLKKILTQSIQHIIRMP